MKRRQLQRQATWKAASHLGLVGVECARARLSSSFLTLMETQRWRSARVMNVLLRRVERAEGTTLEPPTARTLSCTSGLLGKVLAWLVSFGPALTAHGVAKSVFHWWSAFSTRRSRAREARVSAAEWEAVQTMADHLRESSGEELFRQLSLSSSVMMVAHRF